MMIEIKKTVLIKVTGHVEQDGQKRPYEGWFRRTDLAKKAAEGKGEAGQPGEITTETRVVVIVGTDQPSTAPGESGGHSIHTYLLGEEVGMFDHTESEFLPSWENTPRGYGL